MNHINTRRRETRSAISKFPQFQLRKNTLWIEKEHKISQNEEF